MNIIVLDTETISLEKQFIYNMGWVVMNTETGEILETQDLVIDQIWQNKPIMITAYYANKKQPSALHEPRGEKPVKNCKRA